MTRRLLSLLFAVTTILTAMPAAAQTCTANANPFIDVGAGEFFCSDALWLRNANVTLGCNATSYCPTALVSRAQMAAFLRRLASAVKPEVVFAESTSAGFFDLDAGAIVCAHSALVISLLDTGGNARIGQVQANVSVMTTAAADMELRIMRSDDGGPFVLDHVAVPAVTVAPGAWAHVSAIGQRTQVNPPPTGAAARTAQWRLELRRVPGSATTGDVTAYRCQVNLTSTTT